MTEMWKYGNKCFKCANKQIGISRDSWYQSPGLVAMSRAPRVPMTITIKFRITICCLPGLVNVNTLTTM